MSNKKFTVDLSKSMGPSINHAINKYVVTTSLLHNFNDINHFNHMASNHSETKLSPTKLEKRNHTSPHSSCGSSTGSAFSSYCTSSCYSSNCSKEHKEKTSSDASSTVSSPGSSSSSLCLSLTLSCDSSDCNSNFSKSSSNLSSCSSISNHSSPTSFADEQHDEEATNVAAAAKTERNNSPPQIKTRSSTASSRTSNINSNNTSYSSNSSSSNNSNNTNNTTSTIITKVTRSTSNSLKTSNNNHTEASNQNFSKSEYLETITELVDSNLEKKKCLWHKCNYVGHSTEVDNSLIEHIKSKHIFSQKSLRRFRCLWKGCSVYKNPSCSFNWLERHVVDHIETKPFMCIFNGCKRKFRTEEAREKHVQCHITTAENPVVPAQINSPVKTRNHLLLNSAKLALIENIKNKSKSNATSNEVADKQQSKKNAEATNRKSQTDNRTTGVRRNGMKLPNYSQILKTLTKKRKIQDLTAKKFKKAQFKDFLDDCSIKLIENKLKCLNYQSGKVTLNAQIIASHVNNATNIEMFLVQWHPPNIIENEWLEKSHLSATKQIDVSELPIKANEENPFYRHHRFRFNKRK